MATKRNFREYRTIDKAKWPRGEWDREPDKVQWIDEATGLDCLLNRSSLGNWCGYVGVPTSHPLHGKDYEAIDGNIDVHGCLTFANSSMDTGDESKGICHVAEAGRPDHVWWFGFDCAHSGDLCPRHSNGFHGYDHYRNMAYVESETVSLAKQLAAIQVSA